jgi:hypothetical protein
MIGWRTQVLQSGAGTEKLASRFSALRYNAGRQPCRIEKPAIFGFKKCQFIGFAV